MTRLRNPTKEAMASFQFKYGIDEYQMTDLFNFPSVEYFRRIGAETVGTTALTAACMRAARFLCERGMLDEYLRSCSAYTPYEPVDLTEFRKECLGLTIGEMHRYFGGERRDYVRHESKVSARVGAILRLLHFFYENGLDTEYDDYLDRLDWGLGI